MSSNHILDSFLLVVREANLSSRRKPPAQINLALAGKKIAVPKRAHSLRAGERKAIHSIRGESGVTGVAAYGEIADPVDEGGRCTWAGSFMKSKP